MPCPCYVLSPTLITAEDAHRRHTFRHRIPRQVLKAPSPSVRGTGSRRWDQVRNRSGMGDFMGVEDGLATCQSSAQARRGNQRGWGRAGQTVTLEPILFPWLSLERMQLPWPSFRFTGKTGNRTQRKQWDDKSPIGTSTKARYVHGVINLVHPATRETYIMLIVPSFIFNITVYGDMLFWCCLGMHH